MWLQGEDAGYLAGADLTPATSAHSLWGSASLSPKAVVSTGQSKQLFLFGPRLAL